MDGPSAVVSRCAAGAAATAPAGRAGDGSGEVSAWLLISPGIHVDLWRELDRLKDNRRKWNEILKLGSRRCLGKWWVRKAVEDGCVFRDDVELARAVRKGCRGL